MPTARNIAGGAYCNGKVYFAGGQGAGLSGVVTTVDIYDIASSTWSSIPFPNPRRWLTGGSLGDLIFFAGGDVTQSNADYIDIYNTATGQWSVKTMSIAKQYIEIASLGNKIYFAGGVDAGYFPKNTIDIYDLTTNTWTTHNLAVARSRHAAVNVGNRIMFAGGSPIVQGGLPQISVDVFTDATLGFNEFEFSDLKFEFFPNPANHSLVLVQYSSEKNNAILKIFEVTGKEIFKSNVAGKKTEIDVSKFENGMYVVQLVAGDKVSIQKLIIQK